MRDQLHDIVYRYPPTYVLSSEEQDLVWKFRFYLSSHKKALTKFLKCINWRLNDEVTQALWMLANWAPMDVEDALELLSPTFTHPEVRKYAISRLAQAPDEDLLLYLLQLVQALKYEDLRNIVQLHKGIMPEPERDVVCSLMDENDSLLDQSSLSDISGTSSALHSSVIPANQRAASVLAAIKGEKSTMASSASAPAIRASTPALRMERGSDAAAASTGASADAVSAASLATQSHSTSQTPLLGQQGVAPNLCTFLIQRACKNATLANYLYWYLSIEVEDVESVRKQDQRAHDMYAMVLNIFLKALETGEWAKL